MRAFLKYISFLLILTSCEKKTDWPLQTGNLDFIVVNGLITDENKTQSILISNPVSKINEIPGLVSGAEVIVSGNGQVYHFSDNPLSPGFYESDLAFAGIPENEYSLLITWSNTVYSAKAKLPRGIPFTSTVEIIASQKQGLLHISRVVNPFDPRNPAFYELQLDWSKVIGYHEKDSASTHARLLYYSLPTLDVSEVLSPDQEPVDFPPGTIITEKKFTLTNEHAAFFRAMLSETSWQGGLFNSATANVPTNLSSGALGYFGACQVFSRTFVAKKSIQ